MRTKISSFLMVSALLSGCGGQVPPHHVSASAQSSPMARQAAPQAISADATSPVVGPITAEVTTQPAQDTERYGKIVENTVKDVSKEPVSTFSADVDTGAYANVRRFLNQGQLPPVDAVRVEELINYFPLETKIDATAPHPLALATEVMDSPWLQDAKLLRIVMQAQEQKMHDMPPANLVFLVDVSGSMDGENKLPLVKKTLRLLVKQLRPQDKISLITYASGTDVVISQATGSQKSELYKAINQLRAGGSTAGADAMKRAYTEAKKGFVNGGINRILMMTDGDFNVGMVNFDTLKGRVAQQRKSGVSLSTLGFGTGNYNEHLMEQMADAGDGNYSYIDNEKEARKVLQQQLASTLSTVASDVKIQVEFNPATVSQYRLIGYENRILNQEDFNNDQKDAGDIGAGHTVTALYEFVPQGRQGWINASRYASKPSADASNKQSEYAHVNIRYKPVGKSDSVLFSRPVNTASKPLSQASVDSRFTVAVATYGQLLRGGTMVGNFGWSEALALAKASQGADEFELRQEFVDLLGIAQDLAPQKP